MTASTPLRLLIVEDQPLFRDLLASALEQESDVSLVDAVGTVAEARRIVSETPIDVVLLDVVLPDGNGIGLGVSLRREHPELGVVILSANDMLDLLFTLPEDIKRGWSYLSKSATTDLSVLMGAILSASRGITVLDPALVNKSVVRPSGSLAALTEKQFSVLAAVARGLSNQQIADEMNLSLNSIVNYLTAIYAVLGIESGSNARVSAVLRFLEETTRPVS